MYAQRTAVELGAHLAARRKARGLSVQELAAQAGITTNSLRRIEDGDTAISVGALLSTLRALDVLDAVIDVLDQG